MKKLLTEWRKFLKEGAEFTDLLSQVRAGEYEPLTDEVWEVIQDEGYDEELELYNPEDFEFMVLTIPPEDVEALKSFSEEALEKYNRLDIELKEKYENHIDLIDYDNGVVKVVRAREKEEDGTIVYRGVPDFVYDKFMESGDTNLLLSRDIIPQDAEVMNYAIERGFDEEYDMPEWAKEAKVGINATSDKENAEGYGNVVIAMEIVGDDYVELPGGYFFIKDFDQVRIIGEQ